MGEEIKIVDVQAENYGTLIQVDIKSSKGSDRLFIETRQIFKALNNYLYLVYDKRLLEMGAELIDPVNYKNPNLID